MKAVCMKSYLRQFQQGMTYEYMLVRTKMGYPKGVYMTASGARETIYINISDFNFHFSEVEAVKTFEPNVVERTRARRIKNATTKYN